MMFKVMNIILVFLPTAPSTQPDFLLFLHVAHKSISKWEEL